MAEKEENEQENKILDFEFEELEQRIAPSILSSCSNCSGCSGCANGGCSGCESCS